MSQSLLEGGHKLHVCPGGHDYPGCMFCDGGLSACDNCGALEGAWPDDCPPAPMDYDTSTLVHHGRLNYRDGWWRVECCQVMRPVYDLDNYMAEQGYRRDHLQRWERIEA